MAGFRLLGCVEACADGTLVDLGHPRQRAVLAVLLVEANKVVSANQLLNRVWGDQHPLRGRETLYTYLSRLRAVLAVTDGARLRRRSGGYSLVIDDERQVDLHLFHHLRAQARAVGDDWRALEMLRQALWLWRGLPLPELDTSWAVDLRTALEMERLATELDHVDVALRCGLHHDLLPHLSARAERHPLDERIAGQLLLALYRSGRQADVMARYHHIRGRLHDELGTGPGLPLRQLYHRVLVADPELAIPVPRTAGLA